jgi:flagellar FliJ protein
MHKPFPLQTLLDLARNDSDSDSAAARLGALNGHDREMEERLRLLLDYRSEYTAHLARMAKVGMNSVDWRNFREFIDKIDVAIAQQRETVAQAKHQVQTGQHQWHAQQRKLKSFDTLSARHHSSELRREYRQEQKEQDDFALKGFLGGRAVMG